MPEAVDVHMESRNLVVRYGSRVGVGANGGVNLPLYRHRITALIGPSGCGKTTFLRALNRMHDLTPIARVEGEVLLDGENIYAPGVDPVLVRRRVGMVFQKPTAFPTMSIYDNVAAGLRLVGVRDRKRLDEAVERALKGAALWDEVKDRLRPRPAAYPVASNSASPSPGPWRWNPRSSSWTNPPPAWTPSPPRP